MANNKKLAEVRKATQFTSENQPQNRGRRPSALARYIKGGGVSITDVKALLTCLIWEYTPEGITKLLKDKEKPAPMGVNLVLGALSDDLKSKSIANLERLMDRAYGKPTQKDIVEFNDIPDSAKDRLAAIFDDAKDKSKKITPKNVSKTTAGNAKKRGGE